MGRAGFAYRVLPSSSPCVLCVSVVPSARRSVLSRVHAGGDRGPSSQQLGAQQPAVRLAPEVDFAVSSPGGDRLAVRAGGDGVDPVGGIAQLLLLAGDIAVPNADLVI